MMTISCWPHSWPGPSLGWRGWGATATPALVPGGGAGAWGTGEWAWTAGRGSPPAPWPPIVSHTWCTDLTMTSCPQMSLGAGREAAAPQGWGWGRWTPPSAPWTTPPTGQSAGAGRTTVTASTRQSTCWDLYRQPLPQLLPPLLLQPQPLLLLLQLRLLSPWQRSLCFSQHLFFPLQILQNTLLPLRPR